MHENLLEKMIMLDSGDTPTERRDFRAWCFRHGVMASDLAGPVYVDLTTRTVALTVAVPEAAPGDADFPEHRRDEHNQPVTEHRIVALQESPPAWMFGEHLAAQVA